MADKASQTITDGSAQDGSGGESSWDDVSAIAPPEKEETKPVPKKTKSEEPPLEEETQPEVGETGEEAEGELEGEEEVASPDLDDLNAQISQLQAQIAKTNEIANFYATQYNQMVADMRGPQVPGGPIPGQPPPGAVTQPEAPKPIEPGKLPEGILPPERWNLDDANIFRKDMGGYLQHRFNENIQQAQAGIFQALQQPFNQINRTMGVLREHIAKLLHPDDFEEVSKAVIDEVFLLDPQGNPKDVKNPALLAWFKQSPFPELAIYDHGLAKKAPQKIKEGVQKQTKSLLEKVASRPKGPTKPKVSTTIKDALELDWNTPPNVRDQILHKKGLL